jgi:hypothetical protein
MATRAVPQSTEFHGFGYWSVCIRPGEASFEIWEHDSDRSRLMLGADLTLFYWHWQHEICRRHSAVFCPPSPEQLIAQSPNAKAGLGELTGTRWNEQPPMSGWYIYGGDLPENPRDYVLEHIYHVTHRRPEIAPLIALPPGFEFRMSDPPAIWFAQDVAAEGFSAP